MLSRVAEALFWVGRYVERAEDTARLLDVHFHEVLEDPGVDEARACAVLLAVMGVPGDTADKHRDSRAVLELLGYNKDSSSSIVGALSAAWQNARSARRQLRHLFIGVLGRVGHQRRGAETQRGTPGGQHHPRTPVAIKVGVMADSHLWLRRPLPPRETDRGRIQGFDLEKAGVSTAATYTNSHPTRTRRSHSAGAVTVSGTGSLPVRSTVTWPVKRMYAPSNPAIRARTRLGPLTDSIMRACTIVFSRRNVTR